MSLKLRTIKVMITLVAVCLPWTMAYHHSLPAEAAPTLNVDALFQYTTSRNQKVITQAVDFVVSMQNAPTCTRMAASHLMNECKLLENAPDFAKPRPEAYLDNVKTEYAAKLAVCELLSAQPHNPTPPPHCEILVPSPKACGKGGRWWYSNSDFSNDKQCYPAFKMHQYTKCLESLQSKPQFWTSFSNAKQNAVIMCQASRDAIERENQLEIFKNLTQVLGGVTATMQQTTEDYEALIREQKNSADEAQKANEELKSSIQNLQHKAVATVTSLDEKFQVFMGDSMTQLIAALAASQNAEIERIHHRMQEFSEDLMAESSELAKVFTGQLERHHALALNSIQTNHEAQVDSYNTLSAHMNSVTDTVYKTNDAANMSLSRMENIAQRLDTFESQTEYIAEGFAFLSAIPALVTFFARGFVATVGMLFLFCIFYKYNKRLAVYAAGACSSTFLLHTCGAFRWLSSIPAHMEVIRSQPSLYLLSALSTTHPSILIGLAIWLAAYPIVCLNAYVASLLEMLITRLVQPFFVRRYQYNGDLGLLPSIEMPPSVPQSKQHSFPGMTEQYSSSSTSSIPSEAYSLPDLISSGDERGTW